MCDSNYTLYDKYFGYTQSFSIPYKWGGSPNAARVPGQIAFWGFYSSIAFVGGVVLVTQAQRIPLDDRRRFLWRMKSKCQRVLAAQVPPVRLWAYWCGGLSVRDLLFYGVFLFFVLFATLSQYLARLPRITGLQEVGIPLYAPAVLFKMAFLARALGTATTGPMLLLFATVPHSSVLQELSGLDYHAMIRYHRWIGYGIAAVITLHGVLYYAYWLATGVFFVKGFSWSRASMVNNLAGGISWLCSLAMTFTAFAKVRREAFEIFYRFHVLFFPGFLVFGAFHAPAVFSSMAPGLVLIAIDLVFRALGYAGVTTPASARIHPSGEVAELTLLTTAPGWSLATTSGGDAGGAGVGGGGNGSASPYLVAASSSSSLYGTGSALSTPTPSASASAVASSAPSGGTPPAACPVPSTCPMHRIYLAMDSHSRWEWHPFSIAGHSADGSVRVAIKRYGAFTSSLLDSLCSGRPLALRAHIPREPSEPAWQREDVLLILAGGIGAAAALAVLEDVYRARTAERRSKGALYAGEEEDEEGAERAFGGTGASGSAPARDAWGVAVDGVGGSPPPCTARHATHVAPRPTLVPRRVVFVWVAREQREFLVMKPELLEAAHDPSGWLDVRLFRTGGRGGDSASRYPTPVRPERGLSTPHGARVAPPPANSDVLAAVLPRDDRSEAGGLDGVELAEGGGKAGAGAGADGHAGSPPRDFAFVSGGGDGSATARFELGSPAESPRIGRPPTRATRDPRGPGRPAAASAPAAFGSFARVADAADARDGAPSWGRDDGAGEVGVYGSARLDASLDAAGEDANPWDETAALVDPRAADSSALDGDRDRRRGTSEGGTFAAGNGAPRRAGRPGSPTLPTRMLPFRPRCVSPYGFRAARRVQLPGQRDRLWIAAHVLAVVGAWACVALAGGFRAELTAWAEANGGSFDYRRLMWRQTGLYLLGLIVGGLGLPYALLGFPLLAFGYLRATREDRRLRGTRRFAAAAAWEEGDARGVRGAVLGAFSRIRGAVRPASSPAAFDTPGAALRRSTSRVSELLAPLQDAYVDRGAELVATRSHVALAGSDVSMPVVPGRPDLPSLLSEAGAAAGADGIVGVYLSGPDSMNAAAHVSISSLNGGIRGAFAPMSKTFYAEHKITGML